ncbi:MAG: FGGY-family carbohydrate kinase [Clostridiales bacterium]|nr:FGGY-family carbohydrate kinase [Clostridiales bacterium]MDD7431864.1 FGGY-family carbohydrate kinase [Clostridiales bacterium]MDY3062070.1 FGGY-family carbohydrate kinase [Eubacteriales bacterium]
MNVLAYDVGTSGVKTCLYRVDKGTLQLLASASSGYGLRLLPNGGAEQDPNEWWSAMVSSTRRLGAEHAEEMANISGLSFCAQAQSVVLLDEKARPVRPSMSYMDTRAGEIRQRLGAKSPTIAGAGLFFLLKSLYHTGVVAASDKDPVWKYLWVKDNEPELFSRVRAWLDVKDALIARMTGRFSMSLDSAFATLLLDRRSAEPRFCEALIRMLGIERRHLPEIVRSTDEVGPIASEPASELGLKAGIPVFSGGMDSSLIGVGAGCTRPGETHVYMGTSGWVSTVTDKMLVDTSALIASVVGVQPGLYNYFAELETAGKCLEWVRDHLALDEINIYLKKEDVCQAQQSHEAGDGTAPTASREKSCGAQGIEDANVAGCTCHVEHTEAFCRPQEHESHEASLSAGTEDFSSVHYPGNKEKIFRSLYDYLSDVIDKTPDGSNGVIFTPWLHGNRCPFEDARARGMFFNIGLETGKSELLRAVVEGCCYHMHWFLETIEKKLQTREVIRFVGGGALSPVTAQILADILQRPVETIPQPQNVGAAGAALVAAIGLGASSGFSEAAERIQADRRYEPRVESRTVHERNYQVFKTLYRQNKAAFAALNDD